MQKILPTVCISPIIKLEGLRTLLMKGKSSIYGKRHTERKQVCCDYIQYSSALCKGSEKILGEGGGVR